MSDATIDRVPARKRELVCPKGSASSDPSPLRHYRRHAERIAESLTGADRHPSVSAAMLREGPTLLAEIASRFGLNSPEAQLSSSIELFLDFVRRLGGSETLLINNRTWRFELDRRLSSLDELVQQHTVRQSHSGSTCIKKHRRRHQKSELTGKQIEAQQYFGACAGNKTRAAEAMGVSRATFDQHFNAGCAKLGIQAAKSIKTQRLPEDRRGHANVDRDLRFER